MIVTPEQHADLQAHLVYGWLKWAQTYGIQIKIAIATEAGQDLYTLDNHTKVYTDAIIINKVLIPLSKIVGLYSLTNEPLLQTDNVSHV
jgi:hypothetical protein